jgi:hypothetical protein
MLSSCHMLQGGRAGSKHPRYYDTEACAVCAAAMLMARMLGNVQVWNATLPLQSSHLILYICVQRGASWALTYHGCS